MARSRLPVPVRDVLDESMDDATLTRLYARLRAGRARDVVPLKRAWALAAAAACIAALVVLLMGQSPATGPLRLEGGRDVPAKMTSGREGRLAFDDASAIEVATGTELDLLESTGSVFAMAMRAGALAVEVHPGGPRAWRVECGPVTVEVVGTRFHVERTPRFVRVAVDRGVVLVRGEPVPDHVVRLVAGQSIVVPLGTSDPAPSAAAESAPVIEPSAPTPEPTPAATTMVESSAPPARRASVREPAPSASSPTALSANPAPPNAPGAAADLTEADAMRRAGRYMEAAAILERFLVIHGGEPSASLAEFSLGRLYLDALGDPARASGHFERALDHGLPVALTEDAIGRLTEASARAGNVPRACAAAASYHARYPNGRHAATVDRWCNSAPR